jgi:hypothetical protein
MWASTKGLWWNHTAVSLALQGGQETTLRSKFLRSCFSNNLLSDQVEILRCMVGKQRGRARFEKGKLMINAALPPFLTCMILDRCLEHSAHSSDPARAADSQPKTSPQLLGNNLLTIDAPSRESYHLAKSSNTSKRFLICISFPESTAQFSSEPGRTPCVTS